MPLIKTPYTNHEYIAGVIRPLALRRHLRFRCIGGHSMTTPRPEHVTTDQAAVEYIGSEIDLLDLISVDTVDSALDM